MSRKRGRESNPPPPVTPTLSTDSNVNATPVTTRRSLQLQQEKASAVKASPAARRASTAPAPTPQSSTPTATGRKGDRKSIDRSASMESLSQLSTGSGRKSANRSIHISSSKDQDKNDELSIDSSSNVLKSGDTDPSKVDEHPYTLGHCLVVRYRDETERLAKIIERNYHQEQSIWRYYVHYLDFNRRNDEWIDSSRILSPPSVANPLEQLQLSKQHKTGTTSTAVVAVDSLTAAPVGGGSGAMAGIHSLYTTVADLDHDEHEGFDEESLLEHERVTKVKNVQYVQLGPYIMECWYFSPFPKEYYPHGYVDCLYFDEFSLRFFKSSEELVRYQEKYQAAGAASAYRHPPGNEIYRDDAVSMFEIDGAIEKIYCQNLCYFAKLFLDHKTLYWDVDPFLFYVLCTRDARGFHPVGYFSKEKYSESGYNLACILSFPFVQRKGYGRFLMEFSYELSKKEEKVGSPEKPLSDLGALGYRSYWASTIVRLLKQHAGQSISIMDITCATSILPEDVVTTLDLLGLLQSVPVTHTINNNNNNSKNGSNNNNNNNHQESEIVIYAPNDLLDELMIRYPENKLKVDPDKLHWTPFYTMDPKKDKWSIVSMKQTSSSTTFTSIYSKPSLPNTSNQNSNKDTTEPMQIESDQK